MSDESGTSKSKVKEDASKGAGVQHKHKAALAVLAILALVVFVIAAIFMALNKDDSGSTAADSSVASNEPDSEGENRNLELSEPDAAAEAFFSGEEGAAEESQKALESIADDSSKSSKDRQEALDNLADQCFLALDVVCIEDLLPSYQEKDLDDSFARTLIDDIRVFNDDINGIEDRSTVEDVPSQNEE